MCIIFPDGASVSHSFSQWLFKRGKSLTPSFVFSSSEFSFRTVFAGQMSPLFLPEAEVEAEKEEEGKVH